MVFVSFEMIINDADKRDEIIALLAATNELNRSMEGCIRHDYYANLWEPNRVRLYIEYENYELSLAVEKDPKQGALIQKLFAYQASGALTMHMETLRRYHLDNELPPMHGME